MGRAARSPATCRRCRQPPAARERAAGRRRARCSRGRRSCWVTACRRGARRRAGATPRGAERGARSCWSSCRRHPSTWTRWSAFSRGSACGRTSRRSRSAGRRCCSSPPVGTAGWRAWCWTPTPTSRRGATWETPPCTRPRAAGTSRWSSFSWTAAPRWTPRTRTPGRRSPGAPWPVARTSCPRCWMRPRGCTWRTAADALPACGRRGTATWGSSGCSWSAAWTCAPSTARACRCWTTPRSTRRLRPCWRRHSRPSRPSSTRPGETTWRRRASRSRRRLGAGPAWRRAPPAAPGARRWSGRSSTAPRTWPGSWSATARSWRRRAPPSWPAGRWWTRWPRCCSPTRACPPVRGRRTGTAPWRRWATAHG
mmetsp:Transcript_108931/g.308797  ORF Transcript_108931/g.308797 Transcript_108931/m.308797 type:complete len:368 (-) Transcript_108931:189-1292(-)